MMWIVIAFILGCIVGAMLVAVMSIISTTEDELRRIDDQYAARLNSIREMKSKTREAADG